MCLRYDEKYMLKKRWGLSLMVVSILVYLVVSLLSNIWNLRLSARRIKEQEDLLKRLAYREYDLSRKLEWVQGKAFIESEVRNRLHLGKPGEQIVILPDDMPILPPLRTVEREPLKENWELWRDSFL